MVNDSIEVKLAHALDLLRAGHSAEAKELLEHAAHHAPTRADAWHLLGIARYWQHDAAGAVSAFQQAIGLGVEDAGTYNNLGSALSDIGRSTDAIEAFRQAIACSPNSPEPYQNLAETLRDLGRQPEAVDICRRVTELRPDDAEAWSKLGGALFECRRYDQALEAYDRTLALDPDFPFAAGMALHCRMLLHDWEHFESRVAELLQGVDAGKPVASPFILFSIPSSPSHQKQCAQTYTHQKYPETSLVPLQSVAKPDSGRIRIGYFSADFYDHPVGRLTAELFERHDRDNFEIIAFSYGTGPKDAVRQRLEAGFDRFLDVSGDNDDQIASLARELPIDIAIDLTGFTGSMRTGILARRPAPVQASYLGYLGTMGAPYVDYLIGDSVVIPTTLRQHYTEKIVSLPGSFMINGSHRPPASSCPTRRDASLPEGTFVFCCFNNSYKITPPVFEAWMAVLRQCPDSMLWLVGGGADVDERLRKTASLHGIAEERLVFAPRMNLASYLANYQLADLFLDTFFYSAGTTGSDALWSGLPVLSCPGQTFTSRVAASLLHAVGLPELIAETPSAYIDRAIRLANDPELLRHVRSRLSANLASSPLFDVSHTVRHLESAFRRMHERHVRGLTPDHIVIQDGD